VNGYAQSTIAKPEIGNVESHQFRTAECAGEAEQEDRAVAQSSEVSVSFLHHREDLFSGGWCLAGRDGSYSPSNAS
jgi:hypothetical protein